MIATSEVDLGRALASVPYGVNRKPAAKAMTIAAARIQMLARIQEG